MTEANHARPDRTGRILHGLMETFKLPEVVEWIQAEPEYIQKGHNALTLVKNEALSTVVICLKKGESLPEHHAPGQFTFTVLTGKVRFILEPQGQNLTTELEQGQLLILEEPRQHEIVAIEDCAFLLTILLANTNAEKNKTVA